MSNSIGTTVTRFALRLRGGDTYFNADGNWGPIYEAKLWKTNPFPYIPDNAIVVTVSLTFKEDPWEVRNEVV